MKMYKKSELNLVNGLLVTEGGDIVVPAACVIEQANDLETLVQKVAYLEKQPDATPMPSLDGFERKSIKDTKVKFTATTPCLDWKVAEAEAIMDELDDIAGVNRANEMLDDFAELIQFAKDDFVVDCGGGIGLPCFDTPTLGSVLELTVDDITHAVADVCGMDIKRTVEEDEEE